MKLIVTCPCCSNLMLHHLCDRKEYWFCRKCWQEMPVLRAGKIQRKVKSPHKVNLSAKIA